MEKRQAIEFLEYLRQDRNLEGIIYGDALNMAIEALKAQLSSEDTTSDTIDRQETIDRFNVIRPVDPKKDEYTKGIDVGIAMCIVAVKDQPSVQPEPQWISVTERLPDNADHPGAFCPRYQVVTPYGVTEGWYRPHDHEKGGQWFALFWFMSQIYEIWNIDFERGDVPKVIGEAPVMEWRPLPEPYKPNK